jgi:hypothetical protein
MEIGHHLKAARTGQRARAAVSYDTILTKAQIRKPTHVTVTNGTIVNIIVRLADTRGLLVCLPIHV